jgi:hypothetical protein
MLISSFVVTESSPSHAETTARLKAAGHPNVQMDSAVIIAFQLFRGCDQGTCALAPRGEFRDRTLNYRPPTRA